MLRLYQHFCRNCQLGKQLFILAVVKLLCLGGLRELPIQLKAFFYFFASFFVLALYSCSSEEGSGGKERANGRVFRYNQASGISSLDPAFAKDQATMWAVNQLFNGLVQTDEQLNVRPCIAHTWDISPDGLVYTFKLRSDVFFHDHELFEGGKGTKVTAQDVLYSLNRLIDPAVASTGAWLFNGKLAAQEPFKVLNDSTFQLRLQQAFAPMLGILSMQYCSIVPKTIVEHYGKEFRQHPVGTGPFQFKLWKENEALILSANPHYFETNAAGKRLPLIDGVKVSFVENKRNEFLLFQEGKLDLLSGLDATYKDELLSAEGQLLERWNDKAYLLRAPYLNTEYFGFLMQNNANKALENRFLRQAINYGFDRLKMLRYLRNNIGVAATQGFVPPALPPFNGKHRTKGYDYNPAKTAELLKKAGFEGGKNLPPIVLETNTTYQEMAIFVQNALAESGIKIEIQLNQPALLREKAAKGQVSFFRASWIGDYPDAETYLAVLYGKNTAPPNYTRFKNSQYDALYEQSLTIKDDAARARLYAQMDSLLIEEAPIVPLYYDEVLRFVRKGVDNLGINSINLLTLKEVELP